MSAPEALTVSSDSRCLAFVGPSDYIVTVVDALSLDKVHCTCQRSALCFSDQLRCVSSFTPATFVQLLHVDVSILDVDSPRLDSALKVCFSSASTQHLLIATSANKVLWVCAHTGRLLRQVRLPDQRPTGRLTPFQTVLSSWQVSQVHKHQCSSLAVSEDSRFLLTAGHTVVKVWDYDMKLRVNAQVGPPSLV